MAPSTSGDTPEVPLRVHAGSPLAEIFLIDHTFALVRRSVGDLQTSVEPGVYKLKARLNDAEAERLLFCDRELEVDMSQDLHVSPPAPIAATASAPARDDRVTRHPALQAPAPPATAAQVLLVTRSRERGTTPPEASLRDADGVPVAVPAVGLDEVARGSVAPLPPGPYYLRWQGASGITLEQAIPAVGGWQTQVFLVQESDDEAALVSTRVSVFMSRDGFDPGSEELRHSEELRTALADERRIAAPALESLTERAESPTVGLFGAHLMLLARDAAGRRRSRARPTAPVRFEEDAFERLVRSLRESLGPGFPDVVALSTQVRDPDLEQLGPVSVPPLLWRSWVTLVEASNDAPWLVGADLWRRVAASVPLRPFLLWMPDEASASAGVEEVLHRTLTAADDPGDELRRQLSKRLMVPRAVVDALAPGPTAGA